MHIRLLLCPVQMPSLMYLIFSKKQRITFFDPLGGRVWAKKMFTMIKISFYKSLGPFSRVWFWFLPRQLSQEDYFSIFLALFNKSRRYWPVISLANKMFFICSQETDQCGPESCIRILNRTLFIIFIPYSYI